MKIAGRAYRTIWLAEDGWRVSIIDQTRLPFEFAVVPLASVDEAAHAIRAMLVRGAPLIGATAAFGMALAMRTDPSDAHLASASALLRATRPTAVNLMWALDEMNAHLASVPPGERAVAAYRHAAQIAENDVGQCQAIGKHGAKIISRLWEAHQRVDHRVGQRLERLNILTHCNAGWLACVDWGTALAPIYAAHDAGIPVHVWVDETRPRNQGASLTAYELGAHGVPHTVIADNTGGHLMQQDRVHLVIVGSDRTTAHGDVCNKVGTYLKALAAYDNGVPFYVALPSTTIDWTLRSGEDIQIEERDAREVTHITGRTAEGNIDTVQVVPDGSPALNVAFDVTPARFVTGLITERGICAASREGLVGLYPERAREAAE
jgi:methylthioribose-1-phosphate isomerase